MTAKTPAPTTSRSAFAAARKTAGHPSMGAAAFTATRGNPGFGPYGFDGVAKPLEFSPLQGTQATSRNTPMQASSGIHHLGRWLEARLYPSDFVPQSTLGKTLLLPLGLVMLVMMPIFAILACGYSGKVMKFFDDDDASIRARTDLDLM